ncbi:hypothetical protein GEMRC1_002576 [Eukaryota sp. GEM-RC1]
MSNVGTRYPTLGCLVPGSGKPQDSTDDESQPSLATRLVRLLAETDLDNGNDFAFKVCIIGDAAVGKTTLVNRLTKGEFSPFYHATVSVDYSTQQYVIEGCNVTLHLWDTAGQERSLGITSNYFRGANAALLCFDVSSPRSLSNVPLWCSRVDDVCTNDESRPLLFVAGLKTDLRPSSARSVSPAPHSRSSSEINYDGSGNVGAWGCVSKKEGEEVAAGISAEYMEVSARTGDGIEELFDRMASVLLWRHLEQSKREDKDVDRYSNVDLDEFCSSDVVKSKTVDEIRCTNTTKESPSEGSSCSC